MISQCRVIVCSARPCAHFGVFSNRADACSANSRSGGSRGAKQIPRDLRDLDLVRTRIDL